LLPQLYHARLADRSLVNVSVVVLLDCHNIYQLEYPLRMAESVLKDIDMSHKTFQEYYPENLSPSLESTRMGW